MILWVSCKEVNVNQNQHCTNSIWLQHPIIIEQYVIIITLESDSGSLHFWELKCKLMNALPSNY